MKRTLIALTLAAGFFAGCDTVNTIERADPQARPSYVPDRRMITDRELADSLRVFAVKQNYVSGDLLKIELTVQNMHSHDKSFRYRFEWVDKAGMALPSPTDGWKRVFLKGKETTSLTAIATTPRAVDFVIKFVND
jgi:uncharacterized protein YcfL